MDRQRARAATAPAAAFAGRFEEEGGVELEVGRAAARTSRDERRRAEWGGGRYDSRWDDDVGHGMAGAGLGARKLAKALAVLGVVWEGDTQRLACMLILFHFN